MRLPLFYSCWRVRTIIAVSFTKFVLLEGISGVGGGGEKKKRKKQGKESQPKNKINSPPQKDVSMAEFSWRASLTTEALKMPKPCSIDSLNASAKCHHFVKAIQKILVHDKIKCNTVLKIKLYFHLITKYWMIKAIRMEKKANNTRMTAAHCSSLRVRRVRALSTVSLLLLASGSVLWEMKNTVVL